jgi:putative redox protein
MMDSEWKEVSAEWRGEMAFEGKNQTGGSVQLGTLDGKPGVSPMELLLIGVAGCTGVDVVNILGKKRQPLQDLRVVVRAKRADDHPKVYTEIEVTYLLWGAGLSEKAVEQAIELSETKYCSASAMLGKTARITSKYRILAPGEAA